MCKRWVLRCALEDAFVRQEAVRLAGRVTSLAAGLALARRVQAAALLVDHDLLDDGAIARLVRWKRSDDLLVLAIVPRELARGAVVPHPPIDELITPGRDLARRLRSMAGPARPVVKDLSSREAYVVRQTLAGLSLKAMAAHLGCRVQSVSNYRRRAMRKLGVNSLPELGMRFGRQLAPAKAGG